MISHGIVSGALFLCVGVVYDRMHTREIAAYGGLVNRMPAYALVFMVFTMANVGLPGTSGFVGEFLTLLGAFLANTWVAFFATFGVILSAAYALWLYRRVMFGAADQAGACAACSISTGREAVILLPLVGADHLFRRLSGADPGLYAASVGRADDPARRRPRHRQDRSQRSLPRALRRSEPACSTSSPPPMPRPRCRRSFSWSRRWSLLMLGVLRDERELRLQCPFWR